MDQDPFSTVVVRGKWITVHFSRWGSIFHTGKWPGGSIYHGGLFTISQRYFSLKIDSCLIHINEFRRRRDTSSTKVKRVFGTMFGVIRLLLLRHRWQGWVGWEIVIDVKRKVLRVVKSFIKTFGAPWATRSADCLDVWEDVGHIGIQRPRIYGCIILNT